MRVRLIVGTDTLNLAGKLFYTPVAAFGKRGVAVLLLITILSSTLFLFDENAQAATYTFSQSSWAGGTSASTLTHPTNQTGWTSYASNTGIATGTTVTLATTSASVVQTSDATTNTGFNLTGNAVSQTTVTGTGNAASVQLGQTSGSFTSQTLPGISIQNIMGFHLGGDGYARFLNIHTTGVLTYQYCTNGTCSARSAQTIESSAVVTAADSVVGSDGYSRIAYQTNGGVVKFVQCTNLICSTRNTTVIISSASTDSTTIRLVVGSDGYARIAYQTDFQVYTSTLKDLNLYKCTNAACSTGGSQQLTSLDSETPIVISDIRIVSNLPRIAYTRGTAVFYLQCANANCSNAIGTAADAGTPITGATLYYGGNKIDSSGYLRNLQLVDTTTCISWGEDDEGYPICLESTPTTYDIQYTQCTSGNSCSTKNTSTIASLTGAPNLVAHVIGSDDYDRLIYWISASGLIKYFQCTNASCSVFVGPTNAGPMTVSQILMTLATSTNAAKFLVRSTTSAIYVYEAAVSYYSSGTFTSGAIDPGFAPPSWGTLSWTQTGGQTITLKARSDADGDFSNATAWGSCSNITSGQALSTGGCVTNGHRYIQYQATLSTSNTAQTPSLDDVTITYASYGTTGTVTGNIYDATDATNIMGGIAWTEDTSLPSGTTVTVSLRTGASTGAIAGASWTNLTNASSNCSKSSGVVTCTAAALPSGMTSAGNNRYFQYKVAISSTGENTPTVSNVTVTYVVNTRPDFQAAPTAVQNADGTVSIAYAVRDTDTNTGTFIPGFVAPTFQYSLDNGSTWADVATSSLTTDSYANQAVATSTYTTHTATWNVTSQFTGQYDTDAKIRVTVSDRELANNIASSTSVAFTLDTKPPVVGGSPIFIDASQATPIVTVSATDEAAISMKLGIMPNLSDATYVAYATNTAHALSNGDVVYVQFKDAVGNETTIYSATPLSAPGNVFYQDTSNPTTGEWREFFAWGVADDPPGGFSRYNVYRSVDGGSFVLLTTVTNRLVNYIVDNNLDQNSTYAYKVSMEDGTGNISFFSGATGDDAPDGIGGSDLAAPSISGVTSENTNTTGATIVWSTNKLADSTVYYAATTTYPGSDKTLYEDSTGIPSMVEDHEVVLAGLSPNTTYYFMVESDDASSNTGQAASAAYTFTTTEGPVISNVTTAEVFDNEARISWNTNVAADASVYYSTNPDLSEPVEVSGSGSMTTNHSVTLSDLTQGTKYYYYVKSVDAENNVATDKNVISGSIFYYSFNTSSDGQAPMIDDIRTALVGETGATIAWTTDEPATSQIEWGTDATLGTMTTETLVYTRQHAVILTGLTSETPYYYRVISRDKSGNTTTDTNGGNAYTFTTLTPTTISIGGGGGGSGIDRRDPVISNITVSFPTPTSALISFVTDKVANEQIDYGPTPTYGSTEGDLTAYRTSHAVSLNDLTPAAVYHYKISATNIYGGKRETNDLTFTVGQASEVSSVETPPETTTESPSVLESLLMGASDSQLASAFASIASKTAKPLIFGVDVTAKAGADTATIEWVTDKPSNSMVAYARSSDYRDGQPYTISAGNPDERATVHKVILDNLDPATTYHFQAVSKGLLGPVAVSNDGTFETTSQVPDIIDTRLLDIQQDSATIGWETALPSKTTLTVTNTATGETSTLEDPNFVIEHTYDLSELNDSTTYNVMLAATDENGNTSDPVTISVSTALSPGKPEITNLKISTSIIPDRIETTQTIISWRTNKPATSRVRFAEGSKTELDQATALDEALVRDHVIITTALRPGAVYTLSAESGSTGGEISLSAPYTIITPQPRASVVDLIFKNLDTTFGFLTGKQ